MDYTFYIIIRHNLAVLSLLNSSGRAPVKVSFRQNGSHKERGSRLLFNPTTWVIVFPSTLVKKIKLTNLWTASINFKKWMKRFLCSLGWTFFYLLSWHTDSSTDSALSLWQGIHRQRKMTWWQQKVRVWLLSHRRFVCSCGAVWRRKCLNHEAVINTGSVRRPAIKSSSIREKEHKAKTALRPLFHT